MLCTQTILETYRELTEHEEHCDHPWDARYPLDGEWEVCTKCGEIVRPLDFIPVWKTDFMNYSEETK